MLLDDKIKFRVKELESKWKDQKKQEQDKIFELWNRGYTPEEVKKILVEEENTSKA